MKQDRCPAIGSIELSVRPTNPAVGATGAS